MKEKQSRTCFLDLLWQTLFLMISTIELRASKLLNTKVCTESGSLDIKSSWALLTFPTPTLNMTTPSFLRRFEGAVTSSFESPSVTNIKYCGTPARADVWYRLFLVMVKPWPSEKQREIAPR